MRTDAVDLDEFRKEVRAWLEANLKRRRYSGPQAARTEAKTPEEIAESRVLQRKLFDAGYAGISFPKEYGGRGLSAAHERVFREESAGYVMPDFRRRWCRHLQPDRPFHARSRFSELSPPALAEDLVR